MEDARSVTVGIRSLRAWSPVLGRLSRGPSGARMPRERRVTDANYSDVGSVPFSGSQAIAADDDQ